LLQGVSAPPARGCLPLAAGSSTLSGANHREGGGWQAPPFATGLSEASGESAPPAADQRQAGSAQPSIAGCGPPAATVHPPPVPVLSPGALAEASADTLAAGHVKPAGHDQPAGQGRPADQGKPVGQGTPAGQDTPADHGKPVAEDLHVDKLSGAAGAAAADGGAAGARSSGGSPAGSSTGDSDEDAEDAGAGGYQCRPRGSKAAKRDEAEDIQASRVLKASTDALFALAQATSDRTTVAFFSSAEMWYTPEAVPFRRAHARKLMAAAGSDVSPTGTLSLQAGKAAASTPANGADVPVEGAATPSTPALTSTSTPRMPLAQAPVQAPAAAAAQVPASPLAASSTGPEPPARAVMETAASTSAPPAPADGSGTASRGRRSLVTRQAKAAAVLAAASKTLDDENDGIYVVPVFTTRDNGAGHTEDKAKAERDDSCDDETNAEYQKCVECVSGCEFKSVFSPLGKVLFASSFVFARNSGITLTSLILPLRRLLVGPASVTFSSRASVSLASKASRYMQDDRQVEGKKTRGGKKKTFCAAPVTSMAQEGWICPPKHPPPGHVSAWCAPPHSVSPPTRPAHDQKCLREARRQAHRRGGGAPAPTKPFPASSPSPPKKRSRI